MARLISPTAAVRESYLAGEHAMESEEGWSFPWLAEAVTDFEAYAAHRAAPRVQWGVPTTEHWFVEGDEYIGTAIVRHELTPQLLAEGGHVGYHVVPHHRRRGHATEMLGAVVDMLAAEGVDRILVTCDVANTASRGVITKNGGQLIDEVERTARYEIMAPSHRIRRAARSGHSGN